MRSNPLPRVVFFDAAGTLIHLPGGVGHHYVKVARRWSIPLELERIEPAFRRAWKESPAPPETGTARADDDKGWWRDLVKSAFQHSAVPAGCWSEAFFDDLYDHFAAPDVWELYDDVLPVLEKLRHSYRLGVISNWDGRLRTVLQHLGIANWFDPLVISSEHGADKPSAGLFERALSLAGVKASEALHVGDDPECDWRGAGEAGFQVFALNRPENSLRDLLFLDDSRSERRA